MFPLIITGLAFACATVCLSSLTLLSVAARVGDRRDTEPYLPSAQLWLQSAVRNDAIAILASVADQVQQGVEFVSFESRFSGAQLLLRSDSPHALIVRPASVLKGAQQDIRFISFDGPTLAPMAFTQFCLRNPSDCKTQRLLSTGDRIELDKAHWSELDFINHNVNSSIFPERNENGLAGEKWLLSPVRGDCNDYAVTKRHRLIARGWPARTILLSEVVTVSGEHHLVTIVRTTAGDLVLDNLTDQIMPWSHTHYRWLRMQTPRNPNYWASVSRQNV